jgi:hypothetical protein
MASFVRGPAPEDIGRPVLPRAPVPRLAEGKLPPPPPPAAAAARRCAAGLGEGSGAYSAPKGRRWRGARALTGGPTLARVAGDARVYQLTVPAGVVQGEPFVAAIGATQCEVSCPRSHALDSMPKLLLIAWHRKRALALTL